LGRVSPFLWIWLDTGVDIPEVVNLVFMKPVQSPIKLQQMIVTRHAQVQAGLQEVGTGSHFEKKEFLVIGFSGITISAATRRKRPTIPRL